MKSYLLKYLNKVIYISVYNSFIKPTLNKYYLIKQLL